MDVGDLMGVFVLKFGFDIVGRRVGVVEDNVFVVGGGGGGGGGLVCFFRF